MYEPETHTPPEEDRDALHSTPHNVPWVMNEQIQNIEYLPGMTNLIDERFLGKFCYLTSWLRLTAKLIAPGLGVKAHLSDQEPFWLLARRPARSALSLFPFSTNQSPASPPGTDDEFSATVDSPMCSIFDAEMEIMPPWVPQDLSIDGPNTGLVNANPAAPHPPPPGRYVVSRGDALLLNIMDCQRTSSDEWMDLLQNQAAGDVSGTSTDADGEVSEYDDASDSGSAEEMWKSEDEEENPMAMHMLSQRSGTTVRP
jgi:hypothetical protein